MADPKKEDWTTVPIGNPEDIHPENPMFNGVKLRMDDDGFQFAGESAQTTGSGGGHGTVRKDRGFTGDSVNMADAERARAEALWARKEAEALQYHGDRKGMGGTQMAATRALPAKPSAPRAMTHEELMAKAKAMLAAQQAQEQALQGPSLQDRDANGNVLPSWLRGAGG